MHINTPDDLKGLKLPSLNNANLAQNPKPTFTPQPVRKNSRPSSIRSVRSTNSNFLNIENRPSPPNILAINKNNNLHERKSARMNLHSGKSNQGSKRGITHPSNFNNEDIVNNKNDTRPSIFNPNSLETQQSMISTQKFVSGTFNVDTDKKSPFKAYEPGIGVDGNEKNIAGEFKYKDLKLEKQDIYGDKLSRSQYSNTSQNNRKNYKLNSKKTDRSMDDDDNKSVDSINKSGFRINNANRKELFMVRRSSTFSNDQETPTMPTSKNKANIRINSGKFDSLRKSRSVSKDADHKYFSTIKTEQKIFSTIKTDAKLDEKQQTFNPTDSLYNEFDIDKKKILNDDNASVYSNDSKVHVAFNDIDANNQNLDLAQNNELAVNINMNQYSNKKNPNICRLQAEDNETKVSKRQMRRNTLKSMGQQSLSVPIDAERRNSNLYTAGGYGKMKEELDNKIGASRLEMIQNKIKGYKINTDNPQLKNDLGNDYDIESRGSMRLPTQKKAGHFSITDYNGENTDPKVSVEKMIRQRRSIFKAPKAVIKELPMNTFGTTLNGSKRDIEIDPNVLGLTQNSFLNAAINNLGVQKTPNSMRIVINTDSGTGDENSPEQNYHKAYSNRQIPTSHSLPRKSIQATTGSNAMGGGSMRDAKSKFSRNIFYGQKRASIFAPGEKNYKKGNKEDVTQFIKEDEVEPELPMPDPTYKEIRELNVYKYL